MPYQPYQSTWTNPYLPQVQQPQYSPVVPSVTSAYTQPVNGVVKVNGRDSAMQYQLPPNSMSPALFDNNGKVFYIVSTDGTGTKSIETFDFMPHADEPPIQVDGAQFVSRKEFDEFTAKVNAALGAINGVHAAVQPAAADVAGAGGAGGTVAQEAAAGRHAGHARQGDAG
jgi:hypothetical protein